MNKIVMLDIQYEYSNKTSNIHPVVLIGDSDVVLVDCGYAQFLPLLEKELINQGIDPKSITKVYITHHDDDHMGGLKAFKEKYPDVLVVTSVIEAEFVSGQKKSLRLLQAEEVLKSLPDEHKKFGIEFCESLRNVQSVDVDIKVNAGDVLNWAGGCEIIATPGHMPGHTSLYLRAFNAVITGDAAVVQNDELVVANPQYTLDLELATESLEKLKNLQADVYYAYHGGVFKRNKTNNFL